MGLVAVRTSVSNLYAGAQDFTPSQYRDRGILKHPNATISPQELFEDSVVFEPWKNHIAKDMQNLVHTQTMVT